MPWLTWAHPARLADSHPSLLIRPLAAGDPAPVQAVFAGLSPRSRWLRYHTPLESLRPAMLRHLTALAPDHHVAVLATVGDRPAGIARWIRDGHPSGQQAEIAVEVVDRFQDRGIGTALLRAAARSAQDAGVQTFVGHVLPENRPARSWARALGARPDPEDPDTLRVSVSALTGLPGTPPAAVPTAVGTAVPTAVRTGVPGAVPATVPAPLTSAA